MQTARWFRTRRVAAGLASLTVILTAAASTKRDQAPRVERRDWRLIVLGRAQDAGIPHLGCQRSPCVDIRAGRRAAEKISSLGLVDRVSGAAYIFDATPDFPAQVHALTGGRTPDGVFLTHAHIGHYTGLMYLGRESIGARGVPVYATTRMADYLEKNGPWSQLVSLQNIALRRLAYDAPVELAGGVRVTAFKVPHRDEYSDTVGYRIDGPRKKAIFIPDIDRWETWDRSIRDVAAMVDLALLDGTFSSPADASHRAIEEIPHPMMSRTRELLKGVRAKVWFIHLNHTNAQLDAADVVKEGQEFEM